MNRRFILAAMGGLAIAACAPLPNTNPISREVRASLTFSEVSVSTDGTAFESVRASDYSSRLAPDLRGMIEREFADRMSTGGVRMVVDIARLNVAGATTTAFGRDRSLLQGQVQIITNDGRVLGTYAINVVAGDAAETTAGAVIDAAIQSGDGYYRDLLDAFAQDTREQVLGGDLPGQRLIRQLSN
ncbi:hypothetical protein EU803_01835 [Loktanella sp. IMCC34160]|uniref:hypothetical protein n=1 Tax=Loktanella sp. IMCC34160 TaxID=2510646 RepID=UPI00101D1E8C|nr:hypothetical protein [Loktanella sp. IMCC34160]RYG92870.1 hypothetical protein EU803_01835 [Loktanella sp. IMCC34160]